MEYKIIASVELTEEEGVKYLNLLRPLLDRLNGEITVKTPTHIYAIYGPTQDGVITRVWKREGAQGL